VEFAVENAQTLKKRSERGRSLPGAAAAEAGRGPAAGAGPAGPTEEASAGAGPSSARRKRRRDADDAVRSPPARPRCRVVRSAGACRCDMGWRTQAPEQGQAALPTAAGTRAAPAKRASREAPPVATEGRGPAAAPPGASQKAKSRSARQQRARQRQRSGGKGADGDGAAVRDSAAAGAAVRNSAAAGAGAAAERPPAKRQRADAGQRSQPAGVDRRAKAPALASGSAKPAGAWSTGCSSGTGAKAPGRCFRALLALHAPI